MTVDGHMLLRMLEPALRPGSAGSTGNVGKAGQPGQAGEVRPGTQPLEQQSFESLLAGQLQANDASMSQTQSAAQAVETNGEVAGAQAASLSGSQKLGHGHGPLGQLARIDQIENTSLRSLMSQAASQKAGNEVTQVQPHDNAGSAAGDMNKNDFEIDSTLEEFLASE